MELLDTRQARSPAGDLHTSQGRPTIAHRARKADKTKSRNVWRLETWNIRSMGDTEGPIEVASRGNEWGEERKVDLVVRELAQYDVVAGALQKTKWFGCGTYEVGDSMVLTSGRNAPREGQSVQLGERVALVLRWQALAAWRLGGQQWNAWSSRCVSAVLQVDNRPSNRVHLVSYCASSKAASR